MKTVITRVPALIALCLIASLSFAQTAPVAPVTAQDALTAIAPPVVTSDLPAKVLFVGGGFHAGVPSGFTNLLIHAAGPVYAALAEDVTAGKTSTRVGIETIVFRKSGLFLSLKGNAGVATGATATGGAYGVGGSVIYDLARLKLPGYYAAFSGTWDYSNIADLGTALANGKPQQVFGAATYRIGIGRAF